LPCSDAYHRIRNFAEDLQRAIANEGSGQVENMDTAQTSVTVSVKSKRHLGSVSALVTESLKAHKLSEETVIER
jgi:hypothetical protein